MDSPALVALQQALMAQALRKPRAPQGWQATVDVQSPVKLEPPVSSWADTVDVQPAVRLAEPDEEPTPEERDADLRKAGLGAARRGEEALLTALVNSRTRQHPSQKEFDTDKAAYLARLKQLDREAQ